MHWIIRVKENPSDPLSGRYIEGPRSPAEVRRDGYCFGMDRAKAWPFPNERQAVHKARIVARHMSHTPAWMEVILVDPDELSRDANGSLRLFSERDFPIKARCTRCGGRGELTNDVDTSQCRHCHGRGYYFLPLGD